MNLTKESIKTLTEKEWKELAALKNAISDSPASVHYEHMERFTELLVKSLQEKGG